MWLHFMLTVIFDTCKLCKILHYFCFLFPRNDHSCNIVGQGQKFWMMWECDTADWIACSLYEQILGARRNEQWFRKIVHRGTMDRGFALVGKEMFLFMIVAVVSMLSVGAPVHGIASCCLQWCMGGFCWGVIEGVAGYIMDNKEILFPGLL
jgi:hypothetical protein